MGLIMQKWADYHFDLSFMITGNDIVEYMKVVQKSIEQFEPELVQGSRHLTHGNLKLTGGKKMSSRKGNVLLALDILDAASAAQEAMSGAPDREVMLGAVKYAFLKTRVGGDIIYNPEESVSLQGNSGPYLQYAHARACSILDKVADETERPKDRKTERLDMAERSLLRKIGEYNEVIEKAMTELLPHHVCIYLYELAQEFNRFYEGNRVIGDDREELRLALVSRYRDTLAKGLSLLGIESPEKM